MIEGEHEIDGTDQREATPGSRAGTQFGPYRLKRLLGRGGMGEVYEAYDGEKDRTVALKLMSQQVGADDVVRRRMQREAQTAGRLQEPHIVPIHDYGEIDGQLYIDMRLIQGTDLGVVLGRDGVLPPARAVGIMRQVAAALDAAHRAGVVHRDIKPENILLTDDDFAYLVDFGIAAAFTDQQLTKTGTAVGSWNYMAPERFTGDEVTYRADVYALACVLHECLTGTTPYHAESLSALMGAHLMHPIPRPSAQRPGVPTAFDAVVARGMAKDPSHRFATAGDLAQAAHHALTAPAQPAAGTVVDHVPPSGPPPIVPAPAFQPQPHQLPPLVWAPPPRAKRKPWPIIGAAAIVVAALAGTGIWLGTRKTVGSQPSDRTTPAATSQAGTPNPGAGAPPTVVAAQLNSILLSPTQVNGLLNTSGIVVEHNTTDMRDPGPEDTLSDEQCRGALIGFQSRTYKSSGYTATLAQLMQKPNSTPEYIVVQGAVIFASADLARAFVAAQAGQWRNCARKTVTQVNNGKTFQWMFRDVVGDAPKIALQRAPLSGANGLACEHTLDAVSNVVLDVNVCAPRATDQASRIANDMAAKLPK